MTQQAGLSPLRGLIKLRDSRPRRFASYDRTGGNDDRLHISSGETVTIAQTTGAGIITHIWCTVMCASPNYLRKLTLRAYWDGEDTPSVEVPLGDFFGMGHGRTANYASLPLQASPQDGKALNCYFPMPFAEGMRFTIQSECEDEVLFYYYVDLELHDTLEDGVGRFHAQWRRSIPAGEAQDDHTDEEFLFGGTNTNGADNYTILEAQGHGHYVGCLFSVYSLRRGASWDWYGEGDDMIWVDSEPGLEVPDVRRIKQIGHEADVPEIAPRPESAPGANDQWPPTLHGTGTEDYFNAAWCPNQEYSGPYHGIIAGGGENWATPVTVYRFHIEDPVVFQKRIRVTIEHGHANRRSDEISTTAFWYQSEPHAPFPDLPPATDRLPAYRHIWEKRLPPRKTVDKEPS